MTHCVVLSAWLLPLNVMFSGLICAAACVGASLLFIARRHCVAQAEHTVPTHQGGGTWVPSRPKLLVTGDLPLVRTE